MGRNLRSTLVLNSSDRCSRSRTRVTKDSPFLVTFPSGSPIKALLKGVDNYGVVDFVDFAQIFSLDGSVCALVRATRTDIPYPEDIGCRAYPGLSSIVSG